MIKLSKIQNDMIMKEISNFIGVPEKNLPNNKDQLIDAIASEAVRFALFQSVESRKNLTPIHINQLKSWAIRKCRSYIEYFEIDAKMKINEVINNDSGPNMEFLGDIIRLPKGYIIPQIPKFVSIYNERHLLISGFPTINLSEKGIPIIVNGINRIIYQLTPEKIKEYGIYRIEREDYLDKKPVEIDPKELFKFLISSSDKEIWKSNEFESAYVGNTGSYNFLWGVNSTPVRLDEGLISFWKTKFDFNTIYRIKLITNNSSQFAITIPNYYWKRVCLAIDCLRNNKRVATIDSKEGSVILSLTFVPPAAEMRLIYALGGVWKRVHSGKISCEFLSNFDDEVTQIANDLWLKIEKRGEKYGFSGSSN